VQVGIEMTLHSQRKSNSSQWKKIRMMILTRDQWTCQWCGAHGTTADHILPVSKGGTDELENLVCACKKCNFSRQDKMISEMGAGFFAGHSTAMSSRGLISPKNESRSHD
jgi:5-methylcytosine-specific restriction endonuclease McrA